MLASATKLQESASTAEERLYSGERSAIEGLSSAAAAVSGDGWISIQSVAPIREALLAARAEVEEASARSWDDSPASCARIRRGSR